jgi:hypothetical protein
MGGNRGKRIVRKHPFSKVDISAIHIRLLWIGNLGWFEIGALDQAEIRVEWLQRLKIV